MSCKPCLEKTTFQQDRILIEASRVAFDCGGIGAYNITSCMGPQGLVGDKGEGNYVDPCIIDPADKTGKLGYYNTRKEEWITSDEFQFIGLFVSKEDANGDLRHYHVAPMDEGGNELALGNSWNSVLNNPKIGPGDHLVTMKRDGASEHSGPVFIHSVEGMYGDKADLVQDAIEYIQLFFETIEGNSSDPLFIFWGLTMEGGARVIFFAKAQSTGSIKYSNRPSMFKVGGKTLYDKVQLIGGGFRKYADDYYYEDDDDNKIGAIETDNVSLSQVNQAHPWDKDGWYYGTGWRKQGGIPLFDYLAYYHSKPEAWNSSLTGCIDDPIIYGLILNGMSESEAKKLVQDTQDYYEESYTKYYGQSTSGREGHLGLGKIKPAFFRSLMINRMRDLEGLNKRTLAAKILAPWYDSYVAAEAAGDQAALEALKNQQLFVPMEERGKTLELVDHIGDILDQEKKEDLIDNLQKYGSRIGLGLAILLVGGGVFYYYRKEKKG